MTQAGCRQLLEQFVAGHLPEVLRFAVRLTGRLEWAEDVVQEALYRAVRSIHSYRGQAQLRTWFYRILITAFRDHLASQARHAPPGELAEDPIDPRGEDAPLLAMAGELQELIAQRVSALPPRQREVLVLVTYEHMLPDEVAGLLGISPSNVHVNLHCARARLRAELAPYLSDT
jgi:RNA polymerase sigma-70 factor (ECF subfamily)